MIAIAIAPLGLGLTLSAWDCIDYVLLRGVIVGFWFMCCMLYVICAVWTVYDEIWFVRWGVRWGGNRSVPRYLVCRMGWHRLNKLWVGVDGFALYFPGRLSGKVPSSRGGILGLRLSFRFTKIICVFIVMEY